jgi:ABC-type bacteriocin/lantibiotic exporter with double-glycine peptidase domain
MIRAALEAFELPMRSRRVPFVPQVDLSDCGAAALAMILRYHGDDVSLADVKELAPASRDGLSALGIMSAARQCGLAVRAVRVEADELPMVPLPAILYWKSEHFVVLERLRGEREADLVDPAAGRRRISSDELASCFSEVALCFERDEAPARKRRARKAELTPWMVAKAVAAKLLLVTVSALLFEGLTRLIVPVATQLLVDRVVSAARPSWLLGLCALVLLAQGSKILFGLVRDRTLASVVHALDTVLTERMVDRLARLPFSFFQARAPGDIVFRVQSSVTIRRVVETASVAALDVVLAAAYCALMLAYDRTLGALALALAIGPVALAFVARRWLARLASEETVAQAQTLTVATEALGNVEGLKAARGEFLAGSRYASALTESLNARRRAAGGVMLFRRGMRSLDALSYAALLYLGGTEVFEGTVSLGVLAAFLTMQIQLRVQLNAVVDAIQGLTQVHASMDRMQDLLVSPLEPSGDRSCAAWTGAIDLDEVSFSYAPGEPPLLRDVSLRVGAGESILLVGVAGEGKSTLVRLMLGLLRPTSGQVRVDGCDLAHVRMDEYRRMTGAVMQLSPLVDGTLEDNITLGRDTATADGIAQAITTAGLGPVVDGLPDGLRTPVGEGGNRLSYGQRQRVGIARALAGHPRLVILDEVTSSLEPALEAAIFERLASHACTKVIVSHRVSAGRLVDRVVVLDGGRIAQMGTFAELAATPGPFKRALEQERAR